MKTVEKLEKELYVFSKYNTCDMLNKGERYPCFIYEEHPDEQSDEEIADEVISSLKKKQRHCLKH